MDASVLRHLQGAAEPRGGACNLPNTGLALLSPIQKGSVALGFPFLPWCGAGLYFGGRAQPWIICMRSSKVACSGRSGTYIPRSVIEHGESEGLALEYYKSYDVRSLF